MKENLYYLFISGLVLGSGPCLYFCAPILIAYTAIHKATFKKSVLSYLVFSLFKIISYMILGLICALGVQIIHNPAFGGYQRHIYTALGIFIILIAITTFFFSEKGIGKICAWMHKGNIKNVGVLGFLMGLSPCLPLLGILNYIVIISQNAFDAVFYSFIFGIGTVMSPLLILVVLSAKLANKFSQNNKIKILLRIICALMLLFLGTKITLQTLLQ